MATFKCKMCDAVLNVREGTSICVCEYCGTKQTIPMDGNSGSGHNEKHGSEFANPLLKRAFMFLEDGDWGQAKIYCERALDIDPENGRAYLGKLMADVQVSREADLAEIAVDYRPYNNFEKAIRFGDPQMVKKLNAYSVEAAYKLAVKLMDEASLENDYRQAADQFRSVTGYKYANERAAECEKLAKEKKIEAENKQLRKMSENRYISIYNAIFSIPVWCFMLSILSFFCSSAVNIFLIVIVSIAYVLSTSYCRYLHQLVGLDKPFWSIAILNNVAASGSIALIVYVMKLGRNIWQDTFWEAFIILSICSLIFGSLGDRLGNRRAKAKVHNDKST